MNTRNLHIPSNKVSDIERYCFLELSSLYSEGEIRQMVRMLFEGFLGWSTTQFLLNKQKTINQSDLLRFHWAVEDLKKHRPIQYIIGNTQFCDCTINVNEDVLIPRPETEEIINTIFNSKYKPNQILDLCTGSGCIAIALKKHYPNAIVEAIDISDRALLVAQNNALQNQAQIKFINADILKPISWDHSFDLITSNPPYVMRCEAENMEPNVLDYEPGTALWVDNNDPLIFYHAIGQIAQKYLSKDGLLVVEINEQFGKETSQLLESYGLSCQIIKDFRDKERCIWATHADVNQS